MRVRANAALLALSLVLAGCASSRPPAARSAIRTVPESEIVDIGNLAEVAAALATSSQIKTLLALDVDDTLLTARQFFGSGRWYEWQETLANGDPAKVRCRLDIIALNYEAGRMQATQADAPAIINSVAEDKIIVTARSPVSRGATIRELTWAGYELPKNLDGGPDGLIYRWQDAAASKPIQVSYSDGILMVTGQNKGALLLDLWRRLGLRYDRVILVDDGMSNLLKMRTALRESGVAFLGLHYIGIDKSTPTTEEIQEAIKGWQALQELLNVVSPDRLEDLGVDRCFN